MNSKEYYEDVYSKIVYAGATGLIAKSIHKVMEKLPIANHSLNQILELGAGHGQHLQFVKNDYKKYFETDIEKTFLPIRSLNLQKSQSEVVQHSIDAENLSIYGDSSFDRLIATCLLVHLSNPEVALGEWRRVVRNGGWISIYIPCEPGLFLRFARHFTTVRAAKKMNRNHLSFHYREHVSYFSRLNLLVVESFSKDLVQRRFFPFLIPAWNLNLGVIYQIRVDK
jgi:phosphatidylethanolamine/phosphatidyl-N-methylethanolamine N-methyltransferase